MARGFGSSGAWGGAGSACARGWSAVVSGNVGEVFFDVEITADVAQGLFGESHLAEVIAPGVFAGAAANEGLALDGLDGPVGHAAREGLRGDLKGDLGAGLPEGHGEFVREEQGVIVAMLLERSDGVGGVDPWKGEARGVPATEFEAVCACPADDDLQKFKARHTMWQPE